MATSNATSGQPPDFSEPWKFSDVALVVEDQRFHVHRSTLAFWSPVFEKMFVTDFKEKNNDEIALPGKKASEFKEMLQMMYPSLEEKLVTKRNCYFLFELAHEYQIDSIAKKCEAQMLSMVKNRTENDVLAMLVYAQKYSIKTLLSTCIYEARRLTLKELKGHQMRDQIEPDNYLQITEGIIQRLEEQCKFTKENGLAKLLRVSKSLHSHGVSKGSIRSLFYGQPSMTTSQYLTRLKGDDSRSNCNCDTLSNLSQILIELNTAIESLPSI